MLRLHVRPQSVLVLGAVRAEHAVELRLLAAFKPSVLAERGLVAVHLAAVVAAEALTRRWTSSTAVAAETVLSWGYHHGEGRRQRHYGAHGPACGCKDKVGAVSEDRAVRNESVSCLVDQMGNKAELNMSFS